MFLVRLALMSPQEPHLEKELALLKQGYRFIAGLDEAGRGAWAGPVVAAAVILPANQPELLHSLQGLNDSKKLTPQKRDEFFDVLQQTALAVAVGIGSPELVDSINVLQATHHAMQEALVQLPIAPDYLLVDHLKLSATDIPQDSFPKADSISLTVSAASVIAKVTRDRLMIELSRQYPGYGFERHKGYGTRIHREALQKFGPCPVHRMSYRPILLLADR
jgi:ribonuclease HII